MIKNFDDIAFKQIQTISNNFKLRANSNFPHDLFHKSIEAILDDESLTSLQFPMSNHI